MQSLLFNVSGHRYWHRDLGCDCRTMALISSSDFWHHSARWYSLVATLVWVVFGIGIVIAVIMCLIKAYQSQYFKLPIIGNFAEKFSQKYDLQQYSNLR